MISSRVPEGAEGMQLSKYVERAWPMIPGFAVRAAFKKRDVRVNGARESANRILHAGDEVKVFLEKKHEDFTLEVLYSDDALIAFVKPKGLPVDADQDGVGEDTALSRLRRIHESARLVHRLDAGTGGVMLAALNDESENALLEAFRQHKVRKHYAALCAGHPAKNYEHLRAFLKKNAKDAFARVYDRETDGAKPIETAYRVVKRLRILGENAAELDVEIYTGRTHQIRAHLSHIGHSLIGDDKYGDRDLMKKLKCTDVCLWCQSLEISGAPGLSAYEGRVFYKERPEWKIGM